MLFLNTFIGRLAMFGRVSVQVPSCFVPFASCNLWCTVIMMRITCWISGIFHLKILGGSGEWGQSMKSNFLFSIFLINKMCTIVHWYSTVVNIFEFKRELYILLLFWSVFEIQGEISIFLNHLNAGKELNCRTLKELTSSAPYIVYHSCFSMDAIQFLIYSEMLSLTISSPQLWSLSPSVLSSPVQIIT